MSLLELGPVIFGGNKGIIDFLRQHHLLASQCNCARYMEVVQQRDAATLPPIINAHVAPGTIVHTDEWAAYNRVGTLPRRERHGTSRRLTFTNIMRDIAAQYPVP